MKALLVLLALFTAPLIIFFKSDFSKPPLQNDTLTVPTSAPITNISTPFTIESLRKREYMKSTITIESKAYDNEIFEAYVISYNSDENKLYALLSVPKDVKSNSPFLILNHGYIEPGNYSTVYSYKNTFDYFANKGFIVLKPDYRANGNSEGDKTDSLNRLSYPIDVLNLIASLSSLSPTIAESKRDIFMWSHSMGGDISLKVLEVAGSKIKAASLWAPVSAPYPESMLYFLKTRDSANYEKTKELVYKFFSADDFIKLSPSKNVQFIKSKIIMHHGTDDESVPYEWSVNLDRELTLSKIPHVFYTYQNEDHNFSRGANATVLKRDLEFFTSN